MLDFYIYPKTNGPGVFVHKYIFSLVKYTSCAEITNQLIKYIYFKSSININSSEPAGRKFETKPVA